MPRNIPDPPTWSTPAQREEPKLTLKVVTPMFGGGYKAREVDPICVIRPAAIRGHLRFWWRATAGAAYSSHEGLFKAEQKIWGSTEERGAVKIAVERGREGSRVSLTPSGKQYNSTDRALLPEKVSGKKGPQEGYFLFPFQKQTDGTPEAVGRIGDEFTLSISFTDHWNKEKKKLEPLTSEEKTSVIRAVKAWVLLGGVGACTRRGCGTLQVISNNAKEWLPPDKKTIESWVKSMVVNKPSNTHYAHLKGAKFIIGEECKAENNLSAPEVAWRTLGTFWARFRKGHIPGVRNEYKPISRGEWGDYRGVLVPYSKANSRPTSLQLAKPFLGLPIIYQSPKGQRIYAPTIEYVETGRMSSPVILKPIVFADAAVCPMVAVLSAPQPMKIAIDKNEVELNVPTSDKVLAALKVRHPLQAVTVAAKEIWGASNVIEVTL